MHAQQLHRDCETKDFRFVFALFYEYAAKMCWDALGTNTICTYRGVSIDMFELGKKLQWFSVE